MPCLSSQGMGSGEDYEARRKVEKLEAMLCALIRMTGLEAALEGADWQNAGVGGQELRAWWQEHQQKDAARKERERLAAEAEARREEALAKLTEEERVALGLGSRYRR